MISTWHNYQFAVWNVDLQNFKNTTNFDTQLQTQFKKAHISTSRPPESNGDAYSVSDIQNIAGFNDLFSIIDIDANAEKLNATEFKKIKRTWANRMHRNSFGSIHMHGSDVKVLILYYNVPNNSSDLVLVHPNYRILTKSNPEAVPSDYKYNIKVNEGMCIFHHGNMLHGVSYHLSDEPRDAIIIELCK